MIEKTVGFEVEAWYLHELANGRGDEDTRTEVVMVLPRPGNLVLLITKPFYPAGIFRMPSGGVKPGETPEEAFVRESREETGLSVAPEWKLAVITNQISSGPESVVITSHVILGPVTSDVPHPIDEDEQIGEYRETDAAGLKEIARCLGSIDGRWASWGRFRAPAHEVAAEWLAST